MQKQILKISIRNVLAFTAKYHKFSAFLCGMLLATALPPFYQLWAAFIALSVGVYICAQKDKLCSLAAIGYWFGFGYFAVGFYWIGNALLVDIERTGWLYPITLVLNGAFFGIFTIFPFMLTKFSKSIFLKILLLASGWCLSEWFRGFFLTGFPWNPVSSVLALSPNLLQTMVWWGTYGLSLIAVIIFAWPALLLNKANYKTLALSFLAPLALVVLWEHGAFVIAHRPKISHGKAIMVRLVQPSIPQSLKWDKEALEQNLKEYIDLSHGLDSTHIDFTLWGETAVPYDLTYDLDKVRRIRSSAPRYGYLISGFVRYEPDGNKYKPFNSLGVINRSGSVVAVYDKSHLVPFGEYIPLRQYLPEWIKPVANTISEFGRGIQYETIKIDRYPEFAPLICYEIIFSDEIIRKDNKPKWAVVLTNDGWYGVSAGPYQHLVAAQMRAVEEGISIVRSANSGISAVINPYGEITAQIPLNERGFLDAMIKPDEARKTLFGFCGNYIPLTMSCLILLFAVLLSRIKIKRRNF
ncbi:MAG: apolipoprotein N-acyltransferase [Alphaproteobacteria bacterium]|nr:apolipoprotein N-acyltransferase [Alphaproteobacteria bacterium]